MSYIVRELIVATHEIELLLLLPKDHKPGYNQCLDIKNYSHIALRLLHVLKLKYQYLEFHYPYALPPQTGTKSKVADQIFTFYPTCSAHVNKTSIVVDGATLGEGPVLWSFKYNAQNK